MLENHAASDRSPCRKKRRNCRSGAFVLPFRKHFCNLRYIVEPHMFTENVSRLRHLVDGARHAGKPLVFTVPGSGLSAISATKGGRPLSCCAEFRDLSNIRCHFPCLVSAFRERQRSDRRTDPFPDSAALSPDASGGRACLWAILHVRCGNASGGCANWGWRGSSTGLP